MDYREVLQSDTVLDRKYRIDRVIGAGGFGITYQAYDIGLASPVAIKEYYPAQFGMRDASMSVRPRTEGDRQLFDRLRASFLREARTLAQFDHPAIVRVISVFESHGTAYMVMKYESGPSLKAWLQELQRRPTQNELDQLLWPLLDALEAMHRADFLHRDIAPDNIIVRADGSPVLLDFGASRRVYSDMSGTLTGVVKQGYSPQEQYSSDVRVQGPWTDIYALGATLYLTVTGRVPTEATARMLDDGLMPATEAAPQGYRPAFLAAIEAAMKLRPSERPQSVAEWRDLLFFGAEEEWHAEEAGNAGSAALPHYISGVPQSVARTGPRSGATRATSSSTSPQSSPRATSPRSRPRSSPNLTPSRPSLDHSDVGAAGADASFPSQGFDGSASPSQPIATRARSFATSPKGAMALGVGALLLGGGMLWALDAGGSSDPAVRQPQPVAPQTRPSGPTSTTPAIPPDAVQKAALDNAQRLREEQARLARLEAERRAKEEADRRAREEQARLARLEAERRAKEEADRRAREEQARLARLEAERRAKEEADRRAREEQARLARLEAERRAKEEADRRAREEQARLARLEAERRAKEEADRRAREEQARLARLEAERRAKEEADRRAREQEQQQRAQAAERQRLAALDRARTQQQPATPGGTTRPLREIAFAAERLSASAYAQSIAFASGSLLAGGSAGLVRLVDTGARQTRALQASHKDAVASVAFSTDRRNLATGAWDGEIRIWTAADGALVHTVTGLTAPVSTLRYRSESRLLSVHSDGSWAIIEPSQGQVLLRSNSGNDRQVTASAITADGRTAMVALADGDAPFSIEAWQPANGGETSKTAEFKGHTDWVYAVAVSTDEKHLASAAADGTVRLWDRASQAQRAELLGAASHVRALAFSDDNSLVAGGSIGGRIVVWRTSDGQVVQVLDGPSSAIRAIAFDNDGRTLSTASEDGQLRIWPLSFQP